MPCLMNVLDRAKIQMGCLTESFYFAVILQLLAQLILPSSTLLGIKGIEKPSTREAFRS